MTTLETVLLVIVIPSITLIIILFIDLDKKNKIERYKYDFSKNYLTKAINRVYELKEENDSKYFTVNINGFYIGISNRGLIYVIVPKIIDVYEYKHSDLLSMIDLSVIYKNLNYEINNYTIHITEDSVGKKDVEYGCITYGDIIEASNIYNIK